jgi:hypothetical protein
MLFESLISLKNLTIIPELFLGMSIIYILLHSTILSTKQNYLLIHNSILSLSRSFCSSKTYLPFL